MGIEISIHCFYTVSSSVLIIDCYVLWWWQRRQSLRFFVLSFAGDFSFQFRCLLRPSEVLSSKGLFEYFGLFLHLQVKLNFLGLSHQGCQMVYAFAYHNANLGSHIFEELGMGNLCRYISWPFGKVYDHLVHL
jgi:hypothetical protein